MPRYKELIAIGYWGSDEEPELPDPRQFVTDGERELRSKLVRYLRSGITYASWLGYARCRFNCGVEASVMGNRDLTDGHWLWPEGLAHYVEVHEVWLPEEFIERARASDWQVQETKPASESEFYEAGIDCWINDAFWRSLKGDQSQVQQP